MKLFAASTLAFLSILTVQNIQASNEIYLNQSVIKQDPELPFYIINVAAVKTVADAQAKVRELENKGYSAGYLWIPDYASLSGAQYYAVYVGPFSTQSECEIATEAYRKTHPGAYGLLVSQENKRVQINGVGKVTVTANYKQTPSASADFRTMTMIFQEYSEGDYPHLIFKDIATGTEYDFRFLSYNKLGSLQILLPNDHSAFGYYANPRMLKKIFVVTAKKKLVMDADLEGNNIKSKEWVIEAIKTK
jgi:hypothetical protein